MHIRLIDPNDNPTVANIIRTVMTEFGAVGQGFSIQDAEVDRMSEYYADARSRFYVIEENDLLLGCGGIAQLAGGEADTCELKKMYFLSAARGKGFGRRLGELLIQDAKQIGYRRMYIETLQAMTTANQLYQKLGFVRLCEGIGNTGHCGCDTFYALDL